MWTSLGSSGRVLSLCVTVMLNVWVSVTHLSLILLAVYWQTADLMSTSSSFLTESESLNFYNNLAHTCVLLHPRETQCPLLVWTDCTESERYIQDHWGKKTELRGERCKRQETNLCASSWWTSQMSLTCPCVSGPAPCSSTFRRLRWRCGWAWVAGCCSGCSSCRKSSSCLARGTLLGRCCPASPSRAATLLMARPGPSCASNTTPTVSQSLPPCKTLQPV